MTFLAPVSMAIAAAIGGPLLLLFYLLKLRRRPVRVSSVLLWEDAPDDTQANVPLRMLRPALLLLLHLLILALLVLAIGRPVLVGAGTSADRVFFVIDRSASMQARDAPGGPTRLERARARAIELARSFASDPAAPEMTVIATASDAVVAAPPSRSPGRAQASIELVTPTDQPGDLGVAMRLVESLIGGAGAEDERGSSPLVVVLSDGGDADRPLSIAGAEVRFESIGAAPGAAAEPNVGIAALSAQRSADDPRSVRLFVRVIDTSGAGGVIPLQVEVDGERRDPALVRVEPSAGEPGETARTIVVDAPGEALIALSIEEGGSLEADDRAAVLVPPRRTPSILVVGPDPVVNAGVDPFLLDVLEAVEPRLLRVVDAAAYEASVATGAVESFDVVVFDRAAPLRPPPINSLHFGAACPGIESGVAPEAGGPIVSWRRASPVLRDVALDQVVVGRTRVATSTAGVRALASTRIGAVIAEAEDRGRRRVFVGFELSQSNWPVQISFPIFMAATVDQLAPGGRGVGLSYTTGAAVRVAATEPARSIRLEGPVERTLDRPVERGELIDLGLLPRTGVYSLRTGDRATPLAVNLVSREESTVATRQAIVAGGRSVQTASNLRTDRPLLPLLVSMAAGLLAIEWLVYAYRVRS